MINHISDMMGGLLALVFIGHILYGLVLIIRKGLRHGKS
jgi:hypothetical protein